MTATAGAAGPVSQFLMSLTSSRSLSLISSDMRQWPDQRTGSCFLEAPTACSAAATLSGSAARCSQALPHR
mgnify:CR=1 FL=1